jgi:hypothetical protein
MSDRCISCKTEVGPLRRMTVDSSFVSWSMPVCDDCLKRMTGIEFLSLPTTEQEER